MSEIKEILNRIPDYDVYMTVDELHQNSVELANRFPDTVELMEIGESRSGETIDCLRIGNGKYKALIHGYPNPEEAYGGVLLDHLSVALAENDAIREALDYTWYLIKCSDPDGARLNEGFVKGPHTPLNFTRNYYRTPTDMTPETTFPYRFGPLDLNNPAPECRALMTIMDYIPFDFISSLHMMKWGGVSFQVPGPCPGLYPAMYKSARNFDVPLFKILGAYLVTGVMNMEGDYFYYARNYINAWSRGVTGINPPPGCYIFEYGLMRNPNCFMMVPECCIWHDPRMLDDSPSESSVWDVLEYNEAKEKEANQFLLEKWNQVQDLLDSPSPFKRMIEDTMGLITKGQSVIVAPKPPFNERYNRKISIAQKVSTEGRVDLYSMFNLGIFLRTLNYQLEQGENEVLLSVKEEAETKLIEYDQFLNNKYDVTAYPIRNLVGMSLGAILEATEYVKNKKLWY